MNQEKSTEILIPRTRNSVKPAAAIHGC
jgi:hypothetical protein